MKEEEEEKKNLEQEGQLEEKGEQAQESITEEDVEQAKAVSAVAYLIFFLPLLVKPESRFGKFHANQGLLLLITALGINIVGSIIPIIGWFLILPLGFIFTLVLFIMGIVSAVNGKMKRLPLIGGFDIIK